MSFGEKIFNFYSNLDHPPVNIRHVDILDPFQTKIVRDINSEFYKKYYNNNQERTFLIGINPGRFGAGLTGIPFTDPIYLETILKIKNDFPKKHELSSQFIYKVIDEFGGPEKFFGTFYLTAVSPLGFTFHNKNINYYDIKSIVNTWEPVFIKWMKQQLKAGGRRDIGFILGKGANSKYFLRLNNEAKLFKQLIPLPHPRWVMQYHYKNQSTFVKNYLLNLHTCL